MHKACQVPGCWTQTQWLALSFPMKRLRRCCTPVWQARRRTARSGDGSRPSTSRVAVWLYRLLPGPGSKQCYAIPSARRMLPCTFCTLPDVMDLQEADDPLPSALPPTYAAATSPVALKVNFKQTIRIRRRPYDVCRAPRWSHFLGAVISREWLHSSGMLSTCWVSIVNDMSFTNFDDQIRARIKAGFHGGPWKRLHWSFVLKGKWLGNGRQEVQVDFDASNWTEAKAAMHGLVDIRVDLKFFLRPYKEGCTLPPYSRLQALQKDDCRSHSPNGSFSEWMEVGWRCRPQIVQVGAGDSSSN